MYDYLKRVANGLDSNDVEEVRWWFGEIFTVMCENKEVIDKDLYNSISNLKNLINSNIKRFLIIYNRFTERTVLEAEMKKVIINFERKIAELRFFLNKV